MNKRGFTLMELLVYMAIVGIVVVLAGQVFSDSTKMRVRTQGMIEANQVAENLGALFKDDVSQMGAKSSQESRSISSDSFFVAQSVYMNVSNSDFSSFRYTKNGGDDARYDNLTFRYMHYDEDGAYSSVQEVGWFLRNDTLWRSCKTIAYATSAEDGCSADGDSVIMAEDVTSFEITPAKPGVLDGESVIIFPSASNKNSFRLISRVDGTKYFGATIDPSEGGENVAVRDFVHNYDYDLGQVTNGKKVNEFFAAEKNGNTGDWNGLCTPMTFVPGVNYEISFKLLNLDERDRAQMFVAGVDHMAVGFRKLDGSSTTIPDFAFYPPMGDEANDVERNMNFAVRDSVKNVCLAFDVAAYSPLLPMGTLNFSKLQVKKSLDASYVFDDSYEPLLADKKNVKAFRLKLKVQKNKEFGAVSLVVPVPSNGVGNH